MSEQKIINKTNKPNTINSVYQDLIRLGINNNDILLVHSSLSNLGWVCGGAQTVITALMNAVGSDGTLVMPAHSGEWTLRSGATHLYQKNGYKQYMIICQHLTLKSHQHEEWGALQNYLGHFRAQYGQIIHMYHLVQMEKMQCILLKIIH